MKEVSVQKLICKSGEWIILFLFSVPLLHAQKLDVAYVPTPEFVVDQMLDMANAGPGDYLIDLGCGDGRIVIAAARRGAYGHGVDLDPRRIEEARRNAVTAGVADKVVFMEQNIYDTDFSRATIIAMYLFPSINLKLRPLFLKNLEPGTRIVSHDFGMDEWKPDKEHGRMENHAVYLWIVPAQVEGKWTWNAAGKKFAMNIKQEFQKIEISLSSDDTNYNIQDPLLSGRRISFTATDSTGSEKYIFSGRVGEQNIEGVIQVHGEATDWPENWTATSE